MDDVVNEPLGKDGMHLATVKTTYKYASALFSFFSTPFLSLVGH